MHVPSGDIVILFVYLYICVMVVWIPNRTYLIDDDVFTYANSNAHAHSYIHKYIQLLICIHAYMRNSYIHVHTYIYANIYVSIYT